MHLFLSSLHLSFVLSKTLQRSLDMALISCCATENLSIYVCACACTYESDISVAECGAKVVRIGTVKYLKEVGCHRLLFHAHMLKAECLSKHLRVEIFKCRFLSLPKKWNFRAIVFSEWKPSSVAFICQKSRVFVRLYSTVT